ncbi:MAG: hypothetical protein Kow0037_19750 [Calditrichia bacterium]
MSMMDQASNLRLLAESKNNQEDKRLRQETIIVTSGKGGVGKSSLSLILAYALARLNKRVLLVDANLQNPNLHILTNTDSQQPLRSWLDEQVPIEKSAIVELGDGLDLLPNNAMAAERRYYVQEDGAVFMDLLRPLAGEYEFVILDTQTGLNQWNLNLIARSDLSLVVSISDPTSVIDTYMLIKAALPHISQPNFQLVVNQVIGEQTGLEAHQNLNLALEHFMNYQVELLSMVPFDQEVVKAGFEQRPVWEVTKSSRALCQAEKMARMITDFKKEKSRLMSIREASL